MDRKTAIVLVLGLVLMIGAGIGLLILMRTLDLGGSGSEPQSGLADAYLEEVEERCARRYARPVPGGGSGREGASAGSYLEALDNLPDIGESRWTQIMDDVMVGSWNGDSPELPSEIGAFGPAISSVVEGAGRTGGRSPYAFCAIDTDADILRDHQRLARAMALSAKVRVHADDEASAAVILAALVQMELDVGRGGGIVGHVVATTMVESTSIYALAPYAGVAVDPEAIRALVRDLAVLEESWPDLGDNVRIDGLVEETMYAACFMPPGWESPVGPPVMSRSDQESICGMGPGMTGPLWKSIRERSLDLVEALDVEDPSERYARVTDLEALSVETPMWKKIFSPEKLLTEIGAPSIAPRVLADVEHRNILMLARALLALRLVMLAAGSLPGRMDETAWSGLEDGGRPFRDPFTNERPIYLLRDGDTVILRSPSLPDGIAAALTVRFGPPPGPAH
ncbi:MAG: hypothetical protein JRG91_09125 [Deltaproteobacteria bacterium]|nr:hypothetical protein [Deltaproteobacteria bacterium]